MDEWDEPTKVICHCHKEMMALWEDPTMHKVLKHRKVRVEESPSFFLDDLEHITSTKYLPSNDDTRLKTVSISEYCFDMETTVGCKSGSEWCIFDVGGSRSQQPTCVLFFDDFDDVDAIIFLAHISTFDQALTEDHLVNCLEDSVLLWKSICLNLLLAKVNLILFLNKCNMLMRKLEAGVCLSKCVQSFGERSNEVETASQYFKSKFHLKEDDVEVMESPEQ